MCRQGFLSKGYLWFRIWLHRSEILLNKKFKRSNLRAWSCALRIGLKLTIKMRNKIYRCFDNPSDSMFNILMMTTIFNWKRLNQKLCHCKWKTMQTLLKNRNPLICYLGIHEKMLPIFLFGEIATHIIIQNCIITKCF